MRLRLVPSFALGLVATLPLAAQARPRPEAPPAVDVAGELDDFVNTDLIGAASKRMQDVASAPADVVVIRSSDLAALGYRTLGDALGGVLGFRTNEDHGYQGMASAGMYILGDQNTRILVLLDGHALNSPAEVGSSKVGEDFGLPLELVDHIEVVRGPASSLYGSNAFLALVNVVSKAAEGSEKHSTQGALTAGTGGLAELWAQQRLTLGGVTASLMVSGFQRRGQAREFPELQDTALPADADREERESAYLYVKGADWSFAGSAISRTQRLASGPYEAIPGENGTFYRNRRLSGDFKWEPQAGDVHWLVRLFGDRNEFGDSFLKDGGAGTTFIQADRDPDRSLGAEVQGRMALGTRFTLTFGSEQQFHRFNGAYFDPDPAAQVQTDVAYTTGNTYLEGNWEPDAHWNLVGGVQRADWRPTRVRNTVGGVGQDGELSSFSRYTPRFTLIWKPGGHDVVKFIFGQGFRSPTIFERYYTDEVSQLPNPAMKPEVITSEQVSWTRKWSRAWRTHLAASNFSMEDAIIPAVLPGDLIQYQNGLAHWQGKAVELEASWRRAATEASFGAGYYHWTSQGQTLPNVSRFNGLAKVIHRLETWSLAGEARYTSGRENTETGTQVPANWTLRGSLRRELEFGWAQLTVEDATNSRRRDLVSSEYDPVTWMAGDGRSARLTLGARF